jgi:hypothetical protein
MGAGNLHVRRSLARTPGGATFQDVKTHRSARRITIPSEWITSLRWYRRRQHEDRRAAGDTWRDLGLVFSRATGGPWTRSEEDNGGARPENDDGGSAAA